MTGTEGIPVIMDDLIYFFCSMAHAECFLMSVIVCISVKVCKIVLKLECETCVYISEQFSELTSSRSSEPLVD